MPDTADFGIQINFEKGSPDPARIFRSMSELIDAFEAIDVDLISSISSEIEPIAIIEDVEAGSLRAWLSYILKTTDDDALKNLDWKKAVGSYLVRAKYYIINFTENKTELQQGPKLKSWRRDCLI
jgi:hypothetical protein